MSEPLTKYTRADIAVAGILSAERQVMRANLPLLGGEASVEPLHDFRVAVRRSRSALGQLRSALPSGMRKSFRVPLKWIGDVTTPTRDHDVLLETLPPLFESAGLADEGAPLLEAFRAEGEAGRVEMLEALASPRYVTQMAAWDATIAAIPWHPCPGKHAAEHAEPFAGERARALLRRFTKEGEKLDASSPNEAFHEMRKTGKKLRYVIAFFQPVLPEGPVMELLAALKTIQDQLGRFNDLSVQRRLLRPHLSDSVGGAAATRLTEAMTEEQEALRQGFRAQFDELTHEGNRERLRALLS